MCCQWRLHWFDLKPPLFLFLNVELMICFHLWKPHMISSKGSRWWIWKGNFPSLLLHLNSFIPVLFGRRRHFIFSWYSVYKTSARGGKRGITTNTFRASLTNNVKLSQFILAQVRIILHKNTIKFVQKKVYLHLRKIITLKSINHLAHSL